jgi:predicted AAA+ superfamily ATPase
VALTDEQRRAVDAGSSVVVVAGAGTGKTHMLTGRYVHHLSEDSLSPLEVVAVTFTEKAAEELRSRVRERVREQLAAREDLLAELEAAQISTIHALCARVCREHPEEAGVPADCGILDELRGRLWTADRLADAMDSLTEEHYQVVPYPLMKAALEALLSDPLAAGSFDSNITFVHNLTEAVKRSERSMVVVSVPVSERVDETGRSDIELGGEIGKLVAERLEQVLGRLESVWKPVGATEGFEIVRRRLFSSNMNAPARDAVVSAYARMYRDNRSEYPSECVESEYERRLRSAYPIHPELFDRLYEDWSTLEKFQRTRGVLRLMAAVIHELWSAGDKAYMIMPGDVPLDESRVRNQFVRYLPDGWDAVVDTDVDGPDSRPKALDEQVGSLGRYHAARRVARAVFVGSAPSVAGQRVRGIEEVRVRLACVQPSESAAVFADALGRLSDGAAYLYADGSRYWYDTRPNVNREAADRAQQQRREDVLDEITARLRRLATGRGDFDRVHVAPYTSGDVADEPEARLVVLSPESTYRQNDPECAASKQVIDLLARRGGSPRLYRNALVFLTPDRGRMEALEGTTRRYLAWKSILNEEEQLNLDAHCRRQARENREKFDAAVDLQIEEAYQWLLYPGEERGPEGKMVLEWSAAKIGTDGALVTAVGPDDAQKGARCLLMARRGTRLPQAGPGRSREVPLSAATQRRESSRRDRS